MHVEFTRGMLGLAKFNWVTISSKSQSNYPGTWGISIRYAPVWSSGHVLDKIPISLQFGNSAITEE